MQGLVKDASGVIKYRFKGKYTERIIATDMETGKQEIVVEIPKFPQGPQDLKKIYGMNLYALQLNNMSEDLRAKLPPTDSRLRPDLNHWEQANLEDAQAHLQRLTDNQRTRRATLKKQFADEGNTVDMYDERQFYWP